MKRVFIKIYKFFDSPRKTRSLVLKHQGDHYDLKEIYNKINKRYFNGTMNLPITWFGNKHSTPRTRITLGSYNHRTKLIKIHRLLDQPHIPSHFISFVVYHEMLHHVVPPIKQRNRRRNIHHAQFILREKQFEDYDLAKKFDVHLKKELFNFHGKD